MNASRPEVSRDPFRYAGLRSLGHTVHGPNELFGDVDGTHCDPLCVVGFRSGQLDRLNRPSAMLPCLSVSGLYAPVLGS